MNQTDKLEDVGEEQGRGSERLPRKLGPEPISNPGAKLSSGNE